MTWGEDCDVQGIHRQHQSQDWQGSGILPSTGEEKGLAKHGELLTWLKSDCGLGHGHANAIILYIQNPNLARKKIREDARKEKDKK